MNLKPPYKSLRDILALVLGTHLLLTLHSAAALEPTKEKDYQLSTAPKYSGLLDYHITPHHNGTFTLAASSGGWSISTSNRQLVRAFYNSVYLSSIDTPISWTGNIANCTPGSTSSTFKNATLTRINYYRAMAGIPANIAFDSVFNTKAQQAALMMSANSALSHTPPTSWNCYTAEGYQAATSSNLSLGHNAWDAVDGQIRDNGTNNMDVGHRRWLLYPQTQTMGTGDIPTSTPNQAANAIWVFDGHAQDPRPLTRDTFVAWPTKGFNPYQNVPIRWSFSYPNANFSNATVSMSESGVTIPLTIDSRSVGYGENTIVWRPNNLTANTSWTKPNTDMTYQVNVNNVLINGSSTNFSYTVTVIDPSTPANNEELISISGNTNPQAGTASLYNFNSISIAQRYDSYIGEVANSTEIYTAETNSSNVIDQTDSAYTLLLSGNGTNGTTVYRLAPSTASETFELPLDFIPANNSVLQFDAKLGYATNEQTAAIQISTDGGASWKDIYTKVGSGQGSPEDSAFITRTVSLSAYADKIVKLRAEYRHTGYRYTGTDAQVSFLIDNLTLTNARKVTLSTIQDIGNTTNLSLTPVLNKQYILAARAVPWVGYSGLDWSNTLTVIPTNSTLTPINDNQEYVKQLYRDFLAREGESTGITNWTNALNANSITRSQAQKGFIDSAEFSGLYAPLVRLYFGFFGRLPDYQGIINHAQGLKSGTSLAQIANNFALSPEFIARYGNLSNSDYVTRLYLNILGRQPDPAGLQHHLNALNSGMTRGQVALGFTESTENINKQYNGVFVTMLYIGNLRRAPEQAGYDNWVNYLNSGGNILSLIDGFINSQEWRNRF